MLRDVQDVREPVSWSVDSYRRPGTTERPGEHDQQVGAPATSGIE